MRKDRNVLSAYDASEGALYALFLAIISGHDKSPRLCAVDNADHGLNPRLARSLIEHVCGWYLDASPPRQILLTTHNPLVLDGLPLQDDRVRLFTVSRTTSGRTSVRRVEIDDSLVKKRNRAGRCRAYGSWVTSAASRMSEPLRVAAAVEGPTDAIVLSAISTTYWGIPNSNSRRCNRRDPLRLVRHPLAGRVLAGVVSIAGPVNRQPKAVGRCRPPRR